MAICGIVSCRTTYMQGKIKPFFILPFSQTAYQFWIKKAVSIFFPLVAHEHTELCNWELALYFV